MKNFPKCLDCQKTLKDRRSKRCYSCNVTGKRNHSWKGNDASYRAIHHWLKKNYGKADKCENPKCSGESNTFQWSKIKDKKYEHKRENYWQQCSSCHLRYDYTDERRYKAGSGWRGKKRPKHAKQMSVIAKKVGFGKWNKGRVFSDEHKRKLSEARLNYLREVK